MIIKRTHKHTHKQNKRKKTEKQNHKTKKKRRISLNKAILNVKKIALRTIFCNRLVMGLKTLGSFGLTQIYKMTTNKYS